MSNEASQGSQTLVPSHPGSTLESWLAYLENLNAQEINLGLERMNQVAARMGLGQPSAVCISVAGTNGKGSSVAVLERIYACSGYRVGCYSSPHLVRYTERIRIDGREVEPDALCAMFARINEARGDIPLTYFEFGTLAALLLFVEAELDVIVLEVGLGGRLDAVNWVDADLALMTSIGLDHTEWLGDTREAIGREKAGIFRKDRWAVTSDPDTPDSVFTVARECGAKLSVLGVDYGFNLGDGHWDWYARLTGRLLANLPEPNLDGSFQYRNFAGVLMGVELLAERLPVKDAALREAISTVQIAGRFQQVRKNGLHYILDVAHNPQSASALAENLQRLPEVRRSFMLVGMLSDKDRRGVIGILAPFGDDWSFVSLPSARATQAETLAKECVDLLLGRKPAVHTDVASALSVIHAQAQPGDRIIISGSFVTVGEALRHLNELDTDHRG